MRVSMIFSYICFFAATMNACLLLGQQPGQPSTEEAAAEWGGYCGSDYFDTSCCNPWYVSGFGGFVDVDSYGITGNSQIQIPGGPLANSNFSAEGVTADGWGLGMAIGHRLSCRTRIEAEFSYRNNSIDNLNIATNINGQNVNILSPVDGKVNSYTGMTNVYWDLTGLSNGWITPYVGGGIGFSFIDSEFTANAIPAMVNADRSAFAYQGIAGVSIKWKDGVDFFSEYRYMSTHDPNFNVSLPNTQTGFSSQYESHSLFSGLRINLR